MRDVIDCNEWKTEKRHECANMGKVKWLKLWWQLYCTSLQVRDLENFRLMDFCSTECTPSGVHEDCTNDEVSLCPTCSCYANICYVYVKTGEIELNAKLLNFKMISVCFKTGMSIPSSLAQF